MKYKRLPETLPSSTYVQPSVHNEMLAVKVFQQNTDMLTIAHVISGLHFWPDFHMGRGRGWWWSQPPQSRAAFHNFM